MRASSRYRVLSDAIASIRNRPSFRVVEHSVQGNHLHLIVEAEDASALARGMQALAIRIALRLNRHLARKGGVFADRYHDRVLRTPRHVRNALLYVLNNGKKHAAERGERWGADTVDPCSSAVHFGGWRRPVRLFGGRREVKRVTVPPDTWLLKTAWRRRGLLDPASVPGSLG